MSSGIVAKVWNIKGESITKGAKEQISDSISYILNDEKTEIKLDINTLDQLTRECKYVENDLKTFSGAYVGVHNVISSDIATAVGEMMNVKKFFGKTSGRAALHMMISLPEEESDVANAPRLMQLCQDVLKELFPDNQAIFAVHTNTDNLHIHIIVNSVGLNGKKIHQDNKYIKERLQPCVNKYAKWYNFTPNSEWSKKKSASAYPYVQLKMELRDAIDMAIEKADTFESFLNNLQEQGITARIGKHISLKIPGMSKAVRTHNLGPNYTRDAIVERIISKKEKLTLQTKEEYFALIKPDNVFEPVLFQMKKYKEMSDVEKKEVIHELKLGKNPWRENREMNWQLNKIANELNQFERIRSYVDYYSDSGTLQDALDGIISAKKQIEHDKKMVSYAKKKYRPIIKIYDEMKEIEKRAYLYEHQNVTEYRSEFEQYRKLTRRLKDNYGKEIFEVADFIAECDERLLYAHAQLNELSTQYRELKQYALQRGMRLDIKDNFEDIIGIYNRKDKTIEMDSFYVASTGTDVVFKIIKTLGTDENGKNYQMFNISVIKEQFSGKESSTVNSTANSTSASSNKKTDTTNTENTFSTAKTADKPVSVVEDDVEMEGSTNVVAASTISSSSMKQLGESAQTQVPTTTEKAKDQKATITLNQIAVDADAQISSNGASLTDATEAQKNNALKIINWYLNNLDELGKLGASEIRAAANDDNKSVVCDILASVDVVPSADQQTAIDNQEDVDLRLSSADIEDGALYLIVHESQLREGIYDVLLSRASGDSIEINIPDLSPVTVSKITVNDIEQLEMVTESTQTEETPEALVEEESSNTGFRIAMYILLIVAIGGLAALFFIAKKRNGGSIPFKRN